jgi:hypothetical protein
MVRPNSVTESSVTLSFSMPTLSARRYLCTFLKVFVNISEPELVTGIRTLESFCEYFGAAIGYWDIA